MEFFFTADIHAGHDKIRTACNRPFSSVEEMDNTILENFKKTIKPQDSVFHLGDFKFKDEAGIRMLEIPGNWFFVPGNHDKDLERFIRKYGDPKRHFYYSNRIYETDFIINNFPQKVSMCHYPMVAWNCSHYGAWLLHGHVHNKPIPFTGKLINVGVDEWNFFPVSLKQIEEKMRTLPDSWDHIAAR